VHRLQVRSGAAGEDRLLKVVSPVTPRSRSLAPRALPSRGAVKFPPPTPARRQLFGIVALLGVSLLCSHAASGYLVPAQKELGRWVEVRKSGRVAVTLPVRWGDRSGTLYAGGPGRSALLLEGETAQADPGPGLASPLAALWLALDLFTAPTGGDLANVLREAGVDLGRSGYARAHQSRDGVGITLGARGEGEPDLPQVHFGREPLWPVRVHIDGQTVQLGEVGSDGWPLWLAFGDGSRLEITGPVRPTPIVPPWALHAPAPEAASPALPDWRKAFEGVRP
jgi:hypothetical protein